MVSANLLKTLSKDFHLKTGVLQSRLNDDPKKGSSKTYFYYGQQEMDQDLVQSYYREIPSKEITTTNKVDLVHSGDVLFSLVSGRAGIVKPKHDNYLFTQNFVKVEPKFAIDSKYLVYLFNEHPAIRKQIEVAKKGTKVITRKQLQEITLPKLSDYEEQKLIGEIYFNQKRLDSLRHHVVELQDKYMMEILKGDKRQWLKTNSKNN